ncbi:MAG: hypothetical protein RLO09_20405 [Cyclobacteriaceae bacterium]
MKHFYVFRSGLLFLGLFLTGATLRAQTYTYVVEEFNFTNSVAESEEGFRWQQFNLMSEGDGTNTYNTVHKGYLRYEGDDEASERDLSAGISTGIVHCYLTLSGFNLELIAAEETAENDGAERSIAIQLVDNSSGSDVDIARLRFRADFQDVDGTRTRMMRIGDDNDRTASTAGFPFAFHKTDNSVTVGFSIDFTNNTYKYWTNNPDEDDSNWAKTSSDRTGTLNAAVQGLTFNELELRIDHSSGSFGDSGEPRNSDNFFNLDRVLIAHETTTAPTSASLSAATKDNSVTISSNETTTKSTRVQSLTIDAGTTLTVDEGHDLTVIDGLTINGTLVVASSGSLTTYGSVTMGSSGSFEKKRTTTFSTTAGQYSVVGSPVTSATTDVLGGLTYKYDESASVANLNDRFVAVTSSETMTPGDAYFSANLGDISFTGTPNSGDVSVGLTYTSAEGADAGWNLVSNPYPSAIELGSFVSKNPGISGSTYFWDDGGSDDAARTNADYIAVTASGTATAGSSRSANFDGYIRSEQGFFVQATSAATLTFNENMQAGTTVNSNTGYFRKDRDNTNLLRIFLENEGQVSDLVIELNDRATSGFDRLFDARKLNAGKEIGIYSYMVNNDDNWAIQGISNQDLKGDIWLGIDISAAGEYTLRFEDGISDDLFLYDHLTEKVINLQKVTSYTFTSEANKIGQKRFSVSSSYAAEAVLNVENSLEEASFRAYFSGSDLVVLSKDGFELATLTAHDLQGKLLYRIENLNSNSRELRLPISVRNGVVIVNIYDADKKETIKLIR